jgi:hypothetical protein
LNINADLTFASNAATNLKALKLNSQTGSFGTDFVRSIYAVGSDLYYNNSGGTPIQITAGSSLNASSIGGITGMSGTTAGVAFVSASNTFVFTRAPNTASAVAVGDVNIYDTAGGLHPITLKNPGSMGAAYTITYPSALPSVSGTLVLNPNGKLLFTNTLAGHYNVTGTLTLTGTMFIGNTLTLSGGAGALFSGSSGVGLTVYGGSGAHAINAIAGVNGGSAIVGTGNANSTAGVVGLASVSGRGVFGQGADASEGVRGDGGSSGGTGLVGNGGTNGRGVLGTGNRNRRRCSW